MRGIITIIATFCIAFVVSGSDMPDTSSNVSAQELREEVGRLKKENNALRRENQKLRAKLVQQKTTTSSPVNTTVVPSNSELNQNPSGTYWLTTSSKKRHNSGCKYYMKSKGRPCEKDEGTACKICGG